MNNSIGNAPGPGSTIGLVGAHKIATIQDELFVANKSFSLDKRLLIPINFTRIVFDPTAFTGDNFTFLPLFFAATAGPVLVNLYTGTDADADGTPLVPSNRREGQPQPVSIIQLNPTINDPGIQFADDLIPASGSGVGNANGSTNGPGLPFEIDPTMKKLIEFENKGGAGVYLQIKMTWFEV